MCKYDKKFFRNEKGMTLIVSLMIIMVLTLLGATAVMMTTTDLKITGNYRTGETAFYAAEAGEEEARARLRLNAVTGVIISDTMPATLTWERYIGTAADCAELGFNSGNSYHNRVDSLQNNLVYAVKITHLLNALNQPIYMASGNTKTATYTASSTVPCYVATSLGKSSNSRKKIKAEFCRTPPINVPSALYVAARTTIGNNASISGNDDCGGGGNKPGIVTTLDDLSLKTGTQTVLEGSPSPALYDQSPLDVAGMADNLKANANITASYSASTTLTGDMNWGTPSGTTCSVSNIIYYDMQGFDLKLHGGLTGCGILIVNGNLEISGSINWNGLMLTTGSFKLTGGGSVQQNINGAVMAGGTGDVVVDQINGGVSINYCSSAISNVTANLPLKNLSWKEEEN